MSPSDQFKMLLFGPTLLESLAADLIMNGRQAESYRHIYVAEMTSITVTYKCKFMSSYILRKTNISPLKRVMYH